METTVQTPVVIDHFRQEFGFLSNFYAAPIYVDGVRYPSVEHAYHAHKTFDETSRKLIREAKTPVIAKKLGYAVKLREDWLDVRVSLMKIFVKKKFENPFLKELLLATEDAILIEGNTWGDKFWGVCRGVGENHLGRILMEVREELKRENDEDRKLLNF
jgi:ribA/ribD-fused uncharacterized protein